MSFERDVFISYAHIDNKPLTPEQAGWVTLFRTTLQAMLSHQLGDEADVWIDEKELRGNDIFSEVIVDQFLKTASLVSVLTPRYVKSEWCIKEVSEFCQAAERTGGLLVDKRSRVFKVIKTPVGRDDPLPPVVSKMLGYEFYEYDKDRTPRELDPAYGDKAKEEFLRKVYKLAWDIAQVLAGLAASAQQTGDKAAHETPARPVVFLAECSRDRREAREILQAELERHGYTVLPNRQLPSDEEEYRTEAHRLLALCRFSIHLIGGGYGLVPDGPSQKSVVMLQNEIAARQSKAGSLQRVIWLPEGTASDQAVQQAFIDTLHRDAELQMGADLITGDLEQLKGVVHAALQKLKRPEPAKVSAEAGSKLVYVLCDERDRKETVPLLKLLRSRGFDVALPVFTGDATQVREANQELLTRCDAVILFYGVGDEAWKFHQQNELKKIGGLPRGKPLLASYVYLSAPDTDDKQLLLTLDEPNLIDGLNGLPEAPMNSFVQAITTTAR